MSDVVTIGRVPWTRDDMVGALREFASLYKRRPIRDKRNRAGMKSPHMFLAWFALRRLNPRAIVESGVFRGQGTWFFEQACPDAEIHCIEPRLEGILYTSDRAVYYERDFSLLDWSHLPRNGAVLFFDDHQNALERVRVARRLGFERLIFEDNYSLRRGGDCYSLKQAFHDGADGRYLRRNLAAYHELPPVFKTERTRWGDDWNDPTPEPLLRRVEEGYQQLFLDEAAQYTWMCYVELK